MNKKTLVIGASENPERYSYKAIVKLKQHGHEVIAVGRNAGEVGGVPIQTGTPSIEQVHTITVYLNSQNQRPLYDYFLHLKPQRIILNPGAENEELKAMASGAGIEVVEACTLVLLSIGAY